MIQKVHDRFLTEPNTKGKKGLCSFTVKHRTGVTVIHLSGAQPPRLLKVARPTTMPHPACNTDAST